MNAHVAPIIRDLLNAWTPHVPRSRVTVCACPMCEGDGIFEVEGADEQCGWCLGRGTVEVEEPCICGGLGRLADHPCPHCGGK